MPPFSGTPPVGVGQNAATPTSTRPPEGQQPVGGTASAAGGADHEAAAGMSAGGDEGGPSGNRWPRQETLALLKIRSEMDAAFREAALKGPLWDQVSRCVPTAPSLDPSLQAAGAKSLAAQFRCVALPSFHASCGRPVHMLVAHINDDDDPTQ